jgi:molecular chaperone GrpE
VGDLGLEMQNDSGEDKDSDSQQNEWNYSKEGKDSELQPSLIAEGNQESDVPISVDGVADKDEEDTAVRIENLERSLFSMKDKMMRALADAENARRRAEKDCKEAEKYGCIRLARDILAVYDNIQRALALAPLELREQAPDFFSGLDLTQKVFIDACEKHSIRKVEAKIGQCFDSNFHEVMYELPTEDFKSGTVAQVVQDGFIMFERLLRPVYVGIARAPESQKTDVENDE